MDEEEFQKLVHEHDISICGYGPITATIVAAKKLGAKNAKLLSYTTSGDITGDRHAVVGYASIKFTY